MKTTTHRSRRATFPSMPFSFSGLAFMRVFATAASSIAARCASCSYPPRFSFTCYGDHRADIRCRDEHTYLENLADLRRDLGRRLQVISDHRDGLHDGAEDIEHGDGLIEATHACKSSGMCKVVLLDVMKNGGSRRKALNHCRMDGLRVANFSLLVATASSTCTASKCTPSKRRSASAGPDARTQTCTKYTLSLLVYS
jgi:hypothetical protein